MLVTPGRERWSDGEVIVMPVTFSTLDINVRFWSFDVWKQAKCLETIWVEQKSYTFIYRYLKKKIIIEIVYLVLFYSLIFCVNI